MSSIFNQEAFLNTSIEGSNSTQMLPIPAGEYQSIIDGLQAQSMDDGRIILRVKHKLIGEEAEKVAADIGRENLTVTQTVWLDMVNGTLDMSDGKNVGLGRLREAVGQNDGTLWNPNKLLGMGPIMVRVTERAAKDDPETIYNDVSRTWAVE